MPQDNPNRSVPYNQAFGALGETLAATYLQDLGYELLARNWRSGRHGEIDLVMRDRKHIVAIEVKTRSSHRYGTPFESITTRKSARLRRLLFVWAREHRKAAAPLRIDAVAVLIPPGKKPQIEHLRGIA